MKFIIGSVLSAVLFSSTIAALAPARFLACMLPTALAAGAQMPPAGNPNHDEPIPGQSCTHGGDEGHNCECHRVCLPGKGENGRNEIREDPQCRAYCFSKSCACPTPGCEE